MDKNDNLWVGTQHNDFSQTLIKFDGSSWETVSPMTDKKELIHGTVSQLFSDSNRMYVAILSAEEPFSEQLLTFDGLTWNKIYGLPETDFFIWEFNADPHRQAVWIRTFKGIYKLPTE